MGSFTFFVLAMVALFAIAFGVHKLMRLPDSFFSGRYDKPMWLLILLSLNVVGLFLFLAYVGSQDHEHDR